MKQVIKIPTGNVVGIGKFKVFTTQSFNYSIPTLSFIVAKEGERYTASCLHLLLDASATNDFDAIKNLQKACYDFLSELFKNDENTAWEQLGELFKADCIKEFWDGYKDCQIALCKKGLDLDKTTLENNLLKRIAELEQQLEKYEKSTEKLEIDVVSYKPVAA